MFLQAGSKWASRVVVHIEVEKCQKTLTGNYQRRAGDDHGAAGAGNAGVDGDGPVPSGEHQPCYQEDGAEQ